MGVTFSMIRSALCVTLLCASYASIAQNDTAKGRVIKIYPLSGNEQSVSKPSETSQPVNDGYKKPSTMEVQEAKKLNGVEIRKGTVKENIIRIAATELSIPESNVDFRYIPCDLVEKYSYVIPESHFANKYERLTYYASQYSFFSTFNPMTNTVTLEYRGPDVFEHCRKSK